MLDFNEIPALELAALKTRLLFKKEQTDIDVSDFGVIYPYSKLLQEIDVKKVM